MKVIKPANGPKTSPAQMQKTNDDETSFQPAETTMYVLPMIRTSMTFSIVPIAERSLPSPGKMRVTRAASCAACEPKSFAARSE